MGCLFTLYFILFYTGICLVTFIVNFDAQFCKYPPRETKKLNWIEYREIPTYVKFETLWSSAGCNPYVDGWAGCMCHVRSTKLDDSSLAVLIQSPVTLHPTHVLLYFSPRQIDISDYGLYLFIFRVLYLRQTSCCWTRIALLFSILWLNWSSGFVRQTLWLQ
jgi:hypothetical protein